MNVSGVQLAMLAWDLNSAMDREVYATGMRVTVKKTGINVFLREVMQEKILINLGMSTSIKGKEVEDQGRRQRK